MERALGVAVLGLVTGEVPDDQSLVTAAREKHVGAGVWLAFCKDGDALIVIGV